MFEVQVHQQLVLTCFTGILNIPKNLCLCKLADRHYTVYMGNCE